MTLRRYVVAPIADGLFVIAQNVNDGSMFDEDGVQ